MRQEIVYTANYYFNLFMQKPSTLQADVPDLTAIHFYFFNEGTRMRRQVRQNHFATFCKYL